MGGLSGNADGENMRTANTEVLLTSLTETYYCSSLLKYIHMWKKFKCKNYKMGKTMPQIHILWTPSKTSSVRSRLNLVKLFANGEEYNQNKLHILRKINKIGEIIPVYIFLVCTLEWVNLIYE